jgi:hypothetical protein
LFPHEPNEIAQQKNFLVEKLNQELEKRGVKLSNTGGISKPELNRLTEVSQPIKTPILFFL